MDCVRLHRVRDYANGSAASSKSRHDAFLGRDRGIGEPTKDLAAGLQPEIDART